MLEVSTSMLISTVNMFVFSFWVLALPLEPTACIPNNVILNGGLIFICEKLIWMAGPRGHWGPAATVLGC